MAELLSREPSSAPHVVPERGVTPAMNLTVLSDPPFPPGDPMPPTPDPDGPIPVEDPPGPVPVPADPGDPPMRV